MKKIHKTLLSLLTSCPLFFACSTLVNDVNPDRLPKSDNKLVVHGYLSPQDTLLQVGVYVSSLVTGRNVGSFGSFFGVVSLEGATVTLSNQNKSIGLILNPKTGTYNARPSQMPILVGQTYNLKVTLNGQTVESSCTVPAAVNIKEVREDSIAGRNFSSDPKFVPPYDRTYKVFWQDPAGAANYYRVAGYAFQLVRNQTAPNTFQNFPEIQQISFNRDTRNGDLISDERNDGALQASGVGRLSSYFLAANRNPILATRRVELSLIACEKTYYDYHRAVQNYDGDNPFSEPTLVPSNIKGGLGCFAAYNRSTFLAKNR